jgi:hypothetical protein
MDLSSTSFQDIQRTLFKEYFSTRKEVPRELGKKKEDTPSRRP